jgi:hypothetical protein
MISDDRMEPFTDEHGGVWRFYKSKIPESDFEYSYTLQLPPEIHNYIVDTYLGTEDKGPLPENFRFTPWMVEDIIQQWTEMQIRDTGKGERPDHIMEAFRAAIEETVNHRYHLEPEQPFDFDDLVEQREYVMNEPLGDWSQGYYIPSPLLDVEQISQAIDEGTLGERGPEHDDFMRQESLEPVPLNFGEHINHVADYLREKAEYMKEWAAGLVQEVKDTIDTFGR